MVVHEKSNHTEMINVLKALKMYMTIALGKFTKDENEEGGSFYGTLPKSND